MHALNLSWLSLPFPFLPCCCCLPCGRRSKWAWGVWNNFGNRLCSTHCREDFILNCAGPHTSLELPNYPLTLAMRRCKVPSITLPKTMRITVKTEPIAPGVLRIWNVLFFLSTIVLMHSLKPGLRIRVEMARLRHNKFNLNLLLSILFDHDYHLWSMNTEQIFCAYRMIKPDLTLWNIGTRDLKKSGSENLLLMQNLFIR